MVIGFYDTGAIILSIKKSGDLFILSEKFADFANSNFPQLAGFVYLYMK
jgi:hypothetical protein